MISLSMPCASYQEARQAQMERGYI